jgi:hypothetical protein
MLALALTGFFRLAPLALLVGLRTRRRLMARGLAKGVRTFKRITHADPHHPN